AYLVRAGLGEAVFFPSTGECVPPGEAFYKKAVVLAPGYFGHVDLLHARIHARVLTAGIQELRKELGHATNAPTGACCVSAVPRLPEESASEIPDLLGRIHALLGQGCDVLLFREREL